VNQKHFHTKLPRLNINNPALNLRIWKRSFPTLKELAMKTAKLGTEQQSVPLTLDGDAESAHFMPDAG
jgi:hypothetical protein